MNPLRRTLLFFAGLVALAGCDERQPKAVEMPPPAVLAALPVARDVTDHQVFTARTQAVQSVDIKARVTGYLMKIGFVDGGDVKKDQVLFEIDDRPYKAALDQAKAALEYSQAALVKNQADYDIAVNIRKDNPAALSKEDLNKALGARDESKGSVDKAKAAIETATLNYNWCKVTSPLDGRANTHFVDVGNLVTADTTSLTNIVSIRPIWAYFDVDENTAEKVRELVAEGKIKKVEGSNDPIDMALGSDKDFSYKGTVDFVSNQLDPNTATIRVRAVFPNENGFLAAGMFGRIRVPIGGVHKALLVNDRAIGTNQGQKYVMVVGEGNKVEMRIVDVGQLHSGLREVFPTRTVTEADAAGKSVKKTVEILKATDRIIVDGLQRARPGTVVAPTMVDMTTLLVQKQ